MNRAPSQLLPGHDIVMDGTTVRYDPPVGAAELDAAAKRLAKRFARG